MNGAVRIAAKRPVIPRRVLAYAFQSKAPPAEIQIWNVGPNPTDYGVHIWSERSARDVMARYEERGNPLLVDIEHNGATVDGEPAATGGYARLELRAGAPWLVFDWSAYALEQVATRQRLFLSPEYDCDPNTNEIVRLLRVSLVAEPGTHRARVLASAAQRTAKGTSMDPKIAAILALLTSVTDPAAAVDAVKGFIANLEPDGGDALTDEGDVAIAGAPPVTSDEAKKIAAKAAPRAGIIVDPVPGQPAQNPDIPGSPPGTKPGPAPASPPAPGTPEAPVVPPVPVTPPALPARGEEGTVRAAASAAVRQIENATRDHLLQTEGDRLAPSIRVWASTQSLQVVRGLIDAAPARDTALTRVAATRGATQGAAHASGSGGVGLQGAELEELEKGMGTFKAKAPETPHRNQLGQFVFPRMTPTEQRRFQAAAADQKGGK